VWSLLWDPCQRKKISGKGYGTILRRKTPYLAKTSRPAWRKPVI